MPTPEIRVIPITGIPEVHPGDDVAQILANAIRANGLAVRESDIFVIAQKIVSKAEGRIVSLDSINPSEKALTWATQYARDPRVIELVLRECRRIVRMERGVIIAETHHGLICANAGVDISNTPAGTATLLPEDSDRSAAQLMAALSEAFQCEIGIIISDTFGRPWREGLVNVAIGVAGVAPLIDYRGLRDPENRILQASIIAVADELASAAELVMGKTDRVPAAIVRGFHSAGSASDSQALLRLPEQDLFR